MSKKNAFGFSLVEVLLGAAMLGGIGLGVATMMKNMTKGNLKAQTESESLLAFNEMVGILSDPTNCLATFTGKSAASDTITQLSHKGSAKFVTNTAFGNNNLKILSYSIGGYNSTTKESTLTINFEKKQILGGGSIPKTLKLFTEVDGAGTISGCRALATYSQELWKLSTDAPGGIFYAGNIGVGTTTPTAMLDVAGGIKATGGVTIGAVGANTDTTCSVTAGTTRYNATSDKMEYCNKLAKWVAFGGGGVAAVAATGGTVTTSGAYTIHTFTSSGTFTPSTAGNVEYLVVGGGGGAGGSNAYCGGGGAGGFRTGTGFPVTAQAYTITVGAGGGLSILAGSSTFSTITSAGGGWGGAYSYGPGAPGGSGGGGSGYSESAANLLGGSGNIPNTGPSQGNNGGTGGCSYGAGGGGGASDVGANCSGSGGGNGGAGTASSISGSSVIYAGGGGGGTYTGTPGAGGNGGGGIGGKVVNATSGTANTGGGGGGAGQSGVGGDGGSGIVIIRYLTNGS